MLTPLLIQALYWNQSLADSMLKYRLPIYWDRDLHKFQKETSRRNVWPWLFINVAVIGAVHFLGCVIFFANLLTVPKYASILETLFSIAIFCISTGALCTCMSYCRWGPELTEFSNKILALELSLRVKYSLGLTRMKAHTTQKILQNWGYRFKCFCRPNGRVDVIGIFATILVIILASLSLPFPWFTMWLELDVFNLTIQRLLDKYTNTKIIGASVRIICFVIGAAEMFSCFRFAAIISLVGCISIQSCHRRLCSQRISEFRLGELSQLKLVFDLVYDLTAIQFFAFLGLAFVFILVCITAVVIMQKTVPRYLQSIVVLSTIGTISFNIVALHLVVAIDKESSRLYETWWLSLVHIPFPSIRRVLSKILKSRRPIRIPYGTAGVFTEATRTDFFSSLLVNSLNSILTFAGRRV